MNPVQRQILAIPLLALLAAARSAGACQWLSYEPQVESLRGKLALKSYEDPRESGPGKKTVMVLELTSAICAKGTPSDGFNVEERDVHTIQVLYKPAEQDSMRAMLNKDVVVKGTLYHAFSAQPLERLLIQVISVEKPAR